MVHFRDILIALNIKSTCCSNTEKSGHRVTLLDHSMPDFGHIKDVFSKRNQTYEVTQTFNLRKLNISEDRHEKVLYNMLEVTLHELRNKNIYYILYPEHNQAGILHFHGIISAPTYTLWCYVKRMLRRHGFISTNQMDMYEEYELKKKKGTAEGWIKYITKDADKEDYKINPVLCHYPDSP